MICFKILQKIDAQFCAVLLKGVTPLAYELGILFGDLNNPFWQEQELWYRKYLPDFPFDAKIYHLNNTCDADEQAEICGRLLRSNLDALIVNALDEDTLGRSAANVRSRTVLIDAGPKINPAVAGAIDHYFPVKVCNYQEQGHLCTQVLLEQKLSLHRVCCIGGPQRARQSSARVTGALAALAAMPRVEKRVLWSDFTREGGRQAMEQILDWQPDAVFCANDLMALGALDALQEAGQKIPVGGVDMIPSAVFSVKNGGLAVTVGVDGGELVSGLLHAVDDYLSSGIVVSDWLAHNQVVTQSSLAQRRRQRRRFL
jgi:DNA-binding LacI/PurR family transcriptional regulator